MIPKRLRVDDDDIWMVTLIREEWYRDFDKLESWSLRRAKSYVYDALKVLPNSRSFGVFDISLEVNAKGTKKIWAPHLHLLVSGATKDDIRSAFEDQTTSRSLRRPLQVKKVDKLRGAIAYITKLPGVRRARFTLPAKSADGRKRRATNKKPLSSSERKILDETWGALRQAELFVMRGIRLPQWLRVQSNPSKKT